MKYLYALFCTITFIQFNATAQRNFRPGYVVTLRGDTTKGFIDYKEWNQNPRDITFKTTEQAATQQYLPTQVTAFGLNGFDSYRTYTGPVTTGAVDLADLSSGIDSSYVNDNIFLRIITGGKNITLYSYNDKIKTRFFIAEGNASPAELRRYVFMNTQANRTVEFNYFTQQLLTLAMKYTPNNAALYARINKTPYKLADLKAVVLQLNNNTDNYSANKSATGGGSEFFFGAGVNMASATFFGTERFGYIENIFTATSHDQSVSPAIAVGMNFYANKNVKKLFFRGELNFTTNKISATYKGSYVDYNNKIDRAEELTFNQANISFVPQIGYNIYNTNSFKFYLAAGLQLNFSSFSNTHYYGKNTLNGKPDGEQDKRILYRKMTTSVTAKTGVTLANKFDIYLGYGAPVMITDYPEYGIDMSFYRLGINYVLGKK